jgi:hypothetical protein
MNSICIMCILSLFFVLHTFTASAIQKKKKNTAKKPVEYALTVAAIHPPVGEDPYLEVTFNESARFYRISKNAAPAYISLLRESEKKSTAVLVKRAGENSDIIIRVRRK